MNEHNAHNKFPYFIDKPQKCLEKILCMLGSEALFFRHCAHSCKATALKEKHSGIESKLCMTSTKI